MFLVFALLLGFVSGLRTMTAPAAASWIARSGALAVANTPLAFMGFRYTPLILTLFAIAELIGDKLPMTPSRKTPPQFIARIFSGALVGATIGAASQSIALGLIAGVIGAIAGTLGGAAARARLAALFKRDLPAALLEDTLAIVLSVLVATRF